MFLFLQTDFREYFHPLSDAQLTPHCCYFRYVIITDNVYYHLRRHRHYRYRYRHLHREEFADHFDAVSYGLRNFSLNILQKFKNFWSRILSISLQN